MKSLKVALGCAMFLVMATTAGCGGGDDKAACDAIQAEMQNVTTNGMKQISDPTALAKTYNDGAAKVRSEGEKAGGDVKSAANDLAKAMEDTGKSVGAQTGQMPDTNAFISAGKKLKDACG